MARRGARGNGPTPRSPRGGISDAWAPDLVEASEQAATLKPEIADELGLPRGVCGRGGRRRPPVGAVGLGAIRPGEAFISLGTAAQLIVASDVYTRRARKTGP